MKFTTLLVAIILVFVLTACTTDAVPAQATPPDTQTLSPSSAAAEPVLNTPMGELTIRSARFVDEVNGDQPAPGEKILLLELTRPGGEALDPDTFTLEEFQSMLQDTSRGTIYIVGDDGSETISTMAGWVAPEYEQFAIGFRLPDSLTTYQLIWQDNDPMTILPED